MNVPLTWSVLCVLCQLADVRGPVDVEGSEFPSWYFPTSDLQVFHVHDAKSYKNVAENNKIMSVRQVNTPLNLLCYSTFTLEKKLWYFFC